MAERICEGARRKIIIVWGVMDGTFIGMDLGYKDDYLGIEVIFSYHEDSA